MKRHIYLNLSKNTRIIVILIVATLVVSSLVTYKLVSDDSSNDQNQTVVRPVGSAVLKYSGRIVEPPEGYEFVSERQVAVEQDTKDYIFRSTLGEDSDLPKTVIVREHQSLMADQIEVINVDTELIKSLKQYAEYIATGVNFAANDSYKSSVEKHDQGYIIIDSYSKPVSEETMQYVKRATILDEKSDIRTSIETYTNDGLATNEFIDRFKEVL